VLVSLIISIFCCTKYLTILSRGRRAAVAGRSVPAFGLEKSSLNTIMSELNKYCGTISVMLHRART
jgi:hypothetical protein